MVFIPVFITVFLNFHSKVTNFFRRLWRKRDGSLWKVQLRKYLCHAFGCNLQKYKKMELKKYLKELNYSLYVLNRALDVVDTVAFASLDI